MFIEPPLAPVQAVAGPGTMTAFFDFPGVENRHPHLGKSGDPPRAKAQGFGDLFPGQIETGRAFNLFLRLIHRLSSR